MDENFQDKAGSELATEDGRWIFNKRRKLWVPQSQYKKQRWKRFKIKIPFDWLNLIGVLAIPLVVTVLGAKLTQQITDQQAQSSEKQHQIDLQIAQDQQDAITLNTYLDNISDLLLNHNLRKSAPGSEIRQVARARTLTALQSLVDPVRKGTLLRFLFEANLIDKDNVIISLELANLSKVSFNGSVKMENVNLSGAILSNADLKDIDLSGADLSSTDLSDAKLNRAKLGDVNLSQADLSQADLSQADLSQANLSDANLRLATLSFSILHGATLYHTKLNYADLSLADLSKANFNQAYLGYAKLNYADLNYSELRYADLNHANLSNAQLNYADLSFIDLNHAHLNSANLRHANLNHADLSDAILIGAIMPDGIIHS